MEKVKVELELTVKELQRLVDYLHDPHEKKEEEEREEVEEKPKKETEKEEPKKIDKNQVRKRGIELTKAGKQAELKAVFEEFGGSKLGDIDPEDYEAVYERLMEVEL